MRLLYFGSGAFGLPTLESLARQHDLLAIVTQPPRPAGRRRQLTPTPVGAWGEAQGYRVLPVENANDPAVIAQLSDLNADAAVVIAFGQKLSGALIEASGDLVVNLHASLLPRYRGAAPINHAMMQGEPQTGVSVISLAQRMDAGLVYAQEAVAIDPLETAGELHDRLAQLGPGVIGRTLADFATGSLKGEPQDESKATRAPKLSKADATVDFSRPAREIRCRVHGLTPWPGVTVPWYRGTATEAQPLMLRRVRNLDEACDAPPGTVLPNLRVATGEGTLELLELQAPGTRILPASAFAQGHHLTAGDRLG